jgi:xanthine dehydrogenase iron-sulfur cluster and FAD-binding subunit A
MFGASAPPIVQGSPAREAILASAAPSPSTMTLPARPLRFVRGHQTVTLESAPPDAMLLDWLREQGQYGTREGCAEGDCGACTVVLGELHDGQLQLRAVNSCIRLLSSVDGCAVFTIEDVARTDGSLHPAQQAMLECHGSQCGFCTPGFVMSLFALYHEAPCRQDARAAAAQQAVSGNLCRCTGYRPILQAAQTMHSHAPHPRHGGTRRSAAAFNPRWASASTMTGEPPGGRPACRRRCVPRRRRRRRSWPAPPTSACGSTSCISSPRRSST